MYGYFLIFDALVFLSIASAFVVTMHVRECWRFGRGD